MSSFLDMATDFIKDLVQAGYSESSIVEMKVSSYAFERLAVENGHNPKNIYKLEIYTQIGKIKIKRDVMPLIVERENKIRNLRDEILDLEGNL